MYPRAAASSIETGLLKASRPATVLVVATGCQGQQSILAPRGPEAAGIAALWWILLALAGIVFLMVMGAILYGAFHRRVDAFTPSSPDDDADRRATRWIVVTGAAVPAVILLLVFVITLGTLAAVTPGKREADVVIEVVGAQWWWEVRYFPDDPRQRVTLANELHLPVGRTVELRLTARDVIHSFWVPGLQGKIDMIPGRTNRLSFRPAETAVLRGQCAEFCGLQHAWMALTVVTESEDDFERWLDGQRAPARVPAATTIAAGGATTPQTGSGVSPSAPAAELPITNPGQPPPAPAPGAPGRPPTSPGAAAPGASVGQTAPIPPAAPGTVRPPSSETLALGYRTFFSAGCSVCHTLRGTPAAGLIGPDLTHLASRRTLAGGMFANTRGHLAGWISNPQQIKPGTLMPNVDLEAAEFQALLDYLQSLD